MLLRFRTQVSDLQRNFRRSFGSDLSTPLGRFFAHVNFQFMDHGFLRILWTNFDTVAPGVYRSNQPSPRRLRRWAKRYGLREVLNLRGARVSTPYMLELEAVQKLGITMKSHVIPARHAPTREMLTEVLDAMRGMQKPFLMHCKSGADRAGFAAVLYLHVIEGQALATARRHLALKYLHRDSGPTGIIDHFFDTYVARNAAAPIALEDWIRTEYDREALLDSWATKGGKTGNDR